MKEIDIINFQGHTKTTIKVAPIGMTCLTGRSNVGKSSITRAIEWVRTNKPLGTAFIHNGTDNCQVRVDEITRVRDPKLNGYRIEGVEGHLAALRGVPDKITNKLNLSDDNVQTQHDAIFLLDKSPGKTALKLSELVDLEAPLAVLKLIKQKRTKVHTRMNALAINISDCEDKISDLQDVPEAYKEYLALEALNESLSVLNSKYAELRKLIETALECKNDLLSMPDISALPELKQLTHGLRAQEAKKAKLQKLHTLIATAKEIEPKVALKKELYPILSETKGAHARLQLLENILSSMESIKILTKQRRVLRGKCRKAEKAVLAFKEAMDICPTCKRPMDA